MGVVRVYPVAEEVVYELLRQASHFHICVHIQIFHEEAVRLEHLPHCDDVRVHLSPGKRLHCGVEVVGAGPGHLQHRSRGEARPGVAVVLHYYVGIFFLYLADQSAQHARTADSGHVLEAYFVAAVFHDLIDHAHIVFHRVDRGVGDGEGHLGNHSGLLCIFHRKSEVAVVVESAE